MIKLRNGLVDHCLLFKGKSFLNRYDRIIKAIDSTLNAIDHEFQIIKAVDFVEFNLPLVLYIYLGNPNFFFFSFG